MDISTLNRFWKKVEKTKTCWLWRGARSKFGHGRFKIKKQTFFTS